MSLWIYLKEPGVLTIVITPGVMSIILLLGFLRAGISAETHLLLEHALCGHDLHGSAGHFHRRSPPLLLLLPCVPLLIILGLV